MDLMDWDPVHHTDEPDQTDSQPPLATAPTLMRPSATRVGGQTLLTPTLMTRTTSSPSTRAAILNAEWTPSTWRELPEHHRPIPWAGSENQYSQADRAVERSRQIRTLLAQRTESDVRPNPAEEYGGPTGFRRAVNGHTMYRQQQEDRYTPRARVRSPYETMPFLSPPSANEPNARIQPPNERHSHFPVQPTVTRQSATGTNAQMQLPNGHRSQFILDSTAREERAVNSSATLLDIPTGGSGSDSDEDVPQRGVRRTISTNAQGQVPHIALERQMQVPTTQVVFQSASGARHSPIPPARRDRMMGAQRMAGHNDARRALEEVPDLDQHDRRPPPPTKSPEEMMVDLTCKVCFEQTSNVVILPCRKLHSRQTGIIGFIVDEV